jgi:flagellin
LAPDLTAGDAVAAARTSTAIIANPTIVSSTASSTVGVNVLATHDWSGVNNATFTVAVNGGTAQNVVLNTSFALGVAGNAALLLAINGQLTGATATIDSSSHLRITANTTGTTGSIVIGGTVADIGATFTTTAATDGADKLAFSVDGIAVSTTLDSLNNEHAVATGTVVVPPLGSGGLTITSGAVSSSVAGSALATFNWAGAGAAHKITVNVNGTGAQDVWFTSNFVADGGGVNDTALAASITSQLTGATASISAGNILTITATAKGAGDVVVAGNDANTGGVAAFTETHGIAGNNKIMVAVDGGAAKEVDVLNGGANQVFAEAGGAGEIAALVAFNAGLAAAGLGGGAVTAAMDSTFHLNITSATVGGASGVTVSDLATNNPDYGNSGMTAMFGATIVSAHGTTTTASSIAVGIQAAIDAATGTGATNAHATVTLNNDNSISIINDHKGAGHTIGAFTGNAAATGIMGAGTVGAVAGLNRSGADLANYLDGVFASGLLQPAQLTATWNAGTIIGASHPGTLTIASGNNTDFRVNSGTSATASLTTATNDLTAGRDFSGAAANAQAFQISSDGGTTWKDIVLNTSALGTTGAGAQKVVDALNVALLAQTAGVTASLVTSGANYYVKLASSTTGSTSSIQVQNQSAADATAGYSNALGAGKILDGLKTKEVTADANLGFGVSGASFQTAAILAETASANLTSTAPKNFVVDVSGASQALSTLTDPTTALAFSALQYGNDSQAITISANDANGNQQSKTITLKNLSTGVTTDNQAGRNIDQAVSYINQQLQSSNNATLQKIVAVKQNVAGVDKINFISSLASFNVGVGSTANADGVNNGVSTNVVAGVVGAGANMAVDSMLGAQAAVTALAAAIAQLGDAQAAVGKGQNQLAYAVSLAQSQITNFSAAESVIRDANVAQQAANLSKAQVLTQASIAAMAQANSAPQAVLSLLRG